MKKILKNPLFTFILGALIFGSGVLAANTFSAKDIKYTPADINWGVDNVEAAVNSLKLSKTSDNYSTDEKVVGTWIDGKPLYQKTYTLNVPAPKGGTWYAAGVYASDTIYELVYSVVKGYDTNANYTRVVFGTTMTAINKNNYEIVIHSGNLNGTYLGVTIQYTKTTDQATVTPAS